MFNPPTIDPEALFREADREIPRPEPRSPARELATHDGLTGCQNERGFESVVDREIKRLRAEQRRFSVVAISVRGFEAYCAEHGEEAGVSLLVSLATILKGEIREYRDTVARIEGALFAVLLPDTIRDESVHFALRSFASFTRRNIPLEPVMGLFEAERTWSRDRVQRMVRRSIEASAALPKPSIGVYDDRTNRFDSVKERRKER
jgi:diguanylate cyclase (GGDEF)-like protein